MRNCRRRRCRRGPFSMTGLLPLRAEMRAWAIITAGTRHWTVCSCPRPDTKGFLQVEEDDEDEDDEDDHYCCGTDQMFPEPRVIATAPLNGREPGQHRLFW